MAATLPAREADRFAKLAGMLGSHHDGEVVNAARAATGLLARYGMTWRDAVLPVPAAPVTLIPVNPTTSHERAAIQCRRHPHLYSKRELEFLHSVAGFRSISQKQEAWLRDLTRRLNDHRATQEGQPHA